MKKILLIISVLLLALLPVYCSGSAEENPIMELFHRGSSVASKQETNELEKVSQTQSQTLVKLNETLIKPEDLSTLSSSDLVVLKQVQKLVNEAENSVRETREDLIAANEMIKLNQETIVLLKSEDEEKAAVIDTLNKDKEKLIKSNSEQTGRIKELEKKNGPKESIEIGCLYNMNTGLQAGFDLGYKFRSGLTTSVGAYVPVEETIKNPLTLIKPESYTFSAKIGIEF